MKVALELGEKLEVAVIEGNKIVGSLSLELNGFGNVAKAAEPAAAKKPAKAERKTRRGGHKFSAESRKRMSEAQKARWADKKPADEAPAAPEA